MSFFWKFFDEKILPFVFIVSNKPVSLIDLLEANKQVNDKMVVNADSLGFRIKTSRLYILFIVLSHLIILPGIGILHGTFLMADCHFSIMLAIFVTSIFFAAFAIFKEYLIDKMSFKQLKIAWKLHFPFFEFEEYHDEVASIYLEALKKKVAKNDLEFFVFEELSKKQQ